MQPPTLRARPALTVSVLALFFVTAFAAVAAAQTPRPVDPDPTDDRGRTRGGTSSDAKPGKARLPRGTRGPIAKLPINVDPADPAFARKKDKPKAEKKGGPEDARPEPRIEVDPTDLEERYGVPEPTPPPLPPADALGPCAKDVECSDGDVCNGIEFCEQGWCMPGAPLECYGGDACVGVGYCDPKKGCQINSAGAPMPGCCLLIPDCEDGNPCNGISYCDPATMMCTTPEPMKCNDGNMCNGFEHCDPVAGCMVTPPIPCTDYNPCNGAEVCDPLFGCSVEGGVSQVCNDGNACNGVESCDVIKGCIPGTPLSCSDANACNGGESCDPQLGCQAGSPLSCDDGNPCTADYCDPSHGCYHEWCPGGGMCTPGGCAPYPGGSGGGGGAGKPGAGDDGHGAPADLPEDLGVLHEACCAAGGTGCPVDRAVESCVCERDPYCCRVEWDGTCATMAAECGAECGTCCTPSRRGGCAEDRELTRCVCDEDERCCREAWGPECVDIAVRLCGSSCGWEPDSHR